MRIKCIFVFLLSARICTHRVFRCRCICPNGWRWRYVSVNVHDTLEAPKSDHSAWQCCKTSIAQYYNTMQLQPRVVLLFQPWGKRRRCKTRSNDHTRRSRHEKETRPSITKRLTDLYLEQTVYTLYSARQTRDVGGVEILLSNTPQLYTFLMCNRITHASGLMQRLVPNVVCSILRKRCRRPREL